MASELGGSTPNHSCFNTSSPYHVCIAPIPLTKFVFNHKVIHYATVFLILSNSLYFLLRGWVRNSNLQHGQWLPSKTIYSEHLLHLFCPFRYLPPLGIGPVALYCMHTPLHTIIE